MKKITFLLMIVYCCYLQPTYAQFEVVGSEEYGKIYDITYDADIENRVYALTLTNHILQSDDNGETWSILYAHPGKIHELKLMPGNALTFFSDRSMYADYGIFIFDLETHTITKEIYLPSQNADKEWIRTFDIWGQNPDVALVLQEYKIGFAVYGKVQYTVNGGNTWEEVYYTEDNLSISPNKVAINPNDSQKLYITLGNGPSDQIGGLFYSADGGQNWNDNIPGIVLDPIAINPANPDEIYVGTGISFGACSENLYHSTDGGLNWEIVPITWSDYILNNITHIQFNKNNPTDIIVLEEDEVSISTNGGESWQNKVFENAADSVNNYYYGSRATFNPYNENELFVCGPYYPFYSTDKGLTYTRLKTPFGSATDKVDIFKNSDESHLFYGVDFGYVHENMITGEETGYGIRPPNIYTINNSPVFRIDKNVAGRVFSFESSFMDYILYLSNDFGETKSPIFTTFNSTFSCLATSPAVDNTVWIIILNSSGDYELNRIDFNDLNNIVTTTLTVPEQNSMLEICVSPLDPDHIVVASRNEVYSSTDGGESWHTSSTGLVGISEIFCLTQNPLNPEQYTVASDVGIFTSTDNGQSWIEINRSFAHFVQHSTVVDGHMLAAVYPNPLTTYHLMYSTDSGNTWETIDNDKLNGVVAYFTTADFQEESVDVYINSTDLGLVKYTLELSDAQPWTFTETNQVHIIDIPDYIDPAIFGDPLVEGDWVGVFYLDNDGNEKCGGAAQINAEGAALVTAYGDNPDTPDTKEGFASGDEFRWKMYDASEQQEYNADASYDMLMPNQGNFAHTGMSRLIGLEATATGIDATHPEKTVDIYPNPAHDQISFDSRSPGAEKVSLSIIDATGQIVQENIFTGKLTLDVSNYIPGIYFAKIKSNNFSEIRKIVIN